MRRQTTWVLFVLLASPKALAVPGFNGASSPTEDIVAVLLLALFVVGIPAGICFVAWLIVVSPKRVSRKDVLWTLYSTCWAWVGTLTGAGTVMAMLSGPFAVKMVLVVLLSLATASTYALYAFRAERERG